MNPAPRVGVVVEENLDRPGTFFPKPSSALILTAAVLQKRAMRDATSISGIYEHPDGGRNFERSIFRSRLIHFHNFIKRLSSGICDDTICLARKLREGTGIIGGVHFTCHYRLKPKRKD